MLGYANWGLNVFPLLKPALNSSYDKVAGHTFLNVPIFLNKCMTEDLLWFTDQVGHLDGVQMFKNEIWDVPEADLEIWGDASAISLAFGHHLTMLVISQTLLSMQSTILMFSTMKHLPFLLHSNGLQH